MKKTQEVAVLLLWTIIIESKSYFLTPLGPRRKGKFNELSATYFPHDNFRRYPLQLLYTRIDDEQEGVFGNNNDVKEDMEDLSRQNLYDNLDDRNDDGEDEEETESANDSPYMMSSFNDDDDEEDDEGVMYRPASGGFIRNENWLEDATNAILDMERMPLGSLLASDLNSIVGLMIAWGRRESFAAAINAENLLKRVVDEMKEGNSNVFVTTKMYTIAINAWARSGMREGAVRAQEIYDMLIQIYRETKDRRIKPSTIIFNAVFMAWAKSENPKACAKGEELLRQMLTEWNEIAQPDAITISNMLEIYASDGSKRSVTKAEKLVESMDKLGINKTTYIFSSLQNVYNRSRFVYAPEKTMAVLEQMLELSSQGNFSANPNVINYNAVLCACSRSSSKETSLKAIQFLRKMELPVEDGGYDVEPDRMSYALTILACANCSERNLSAKLAESILEVMEQRSEAAAKRREEVSSVAPPLVYMDRECYNVALRAIAQSSHPDALNRILKIISRMEKGSKKPGHEHIRPNVRTWNFALNACSRMKTKESAQQAESIIKHMFKLHNNGVPDSKPDEFSYSAILTSYQRLSTKEAAQRAHDILSHMDELHERGILDNPPDVFHYTIVIFSWAWSGSRDAPERCLEILSRMRRKHEQGVPKVKPSIRTWNAILDCLSRSRRAEEAEQVLYYMLSLARDGDIDAKPDAFSFLSVINAFLKSEVQDAGRRAELVLERCLEHAELENGEMLELKAFTTILGYYGRQKLPDSPYRAEYILNRLVSLFEAGHVALSPHVSCFTSVMEAYKAQRNPNAGDCAENLMKKMIKLKRDYNAKHLELNAGVMNSVLSCWASSLGHADAGSRAERLLDLMEERGREGDESMMPNARSYVEVLLAYSKSSAPDKASRAFDVLQRMKARYKEGKLNNIPLQSSYSHVINACAFSVSTNEESDLQILNIALDVMLEFDGIKLEHRSKVKTYGWFFHACSQLKIPEEVKMRSLKKVFRLCCQKGLVDGFVLDKVKSATSESQFAELMSPLFPQISQNKSKNYKGNKTQISIKQNINLTNLPSDWTSGENVSRKKFQFR